MASTLTAPESRKLSSALAWRSASFLDLVIVALVSATFTWLAVATKSFWGDELWSIATAAGPFSDLVASVRHDVHPPLYFILLKGWIACFGDGEIGLRIFSGVIGCALLLLALSLFRRLFPARRFHPFWILLCFSSELWLYAPMMRYYAFAGCLVLCSTNLLLSWLKSNSTATLACLLVSYIALLYSSYPGATLIALHFICVWFTAPRRVKAMAAILTGCFVLYLPWMQTLVAQTQKVPSIGVPAKELQNPVLQVALKVAYGGVSFLVGETTYPFEVAIAASLLVIAVLILWQNYSRL